MQNALSPAESAKALGAYYTDVQVADFLVRWALRGPTDTVLDPSFGGGVFLRSSCKRLASLGGVPARQVFGVEIDSAVHGRITEKLADEFGVSRRNLHNDDFFGCPPFEVDAVVGNPPFIRYQRFTGDMRQRALARAAEHGVRLSELSSSWLPFLLYSISQLKPGGRLAMVIPVELTHAAYARPALEILHRSFARTLILTFRKKLFPDLSEDTLLLLAENKASGPGVFSMRDLPSAGALADLDLENIRGLRLIDADRLASGAERVIEQYISRKARSLYNQLKASAEVQTFGALADVGIGYVTGANSFFHLNEQTAKYWQIPSHFLRPAVRRGRALSGLRFTQNDWRHALDSGETGFLLRVQPNDKLAPGLKRYVLHGEATGVNRGYKCRIRKPWYSVPHVYEPDAFLSYMSGFTPRLASNHARAVAPNSLHIVRLHPSVGLTADELATLWHTSLTRLSVEIEGHALGGGMLKLEPTEAENVLVAVPRNVKRLSQYSLDIDRKLRESGEEAASILADELILQRQHGLSADDCRLLRSAANELRSRRYRRDLEPKDETAE